MTARSPIGDPEDREAWDNGNAAIAKRNLLWSVICEHVGFSIWSMFSVMALFMGPEYGISVDQKFVIAATATLVGSCLRIPLHPGHRAFRRSQLGHLQCRRAAHSHGPHHHADDESG